MPPFTSNQAVAWGANLATTVLLGSLVQASAQAIELADGTTYFANVPRLENARTTYNSARVFGATYYFTLHVPDDAGEPLQRVVFNQQQGVDPISFNLKRTQAYMNQQKKQLLPIAEASTDEKGSISIFFDPPISPGETITIGLRPYRNPRSSGVYLFGVTAFPQGEQAHGQFLGYGRLHFYDHFRWPSYWGH